MKQLHALTGALLLAASLPATAALPGAPAYIDDSAYLPAAKQRILPPMFEQTLTSTRYIAKTDNPLITEAEASDFKRTSTYEQTRLWLRKLAAASGGKVVLSELPEKSGCAYTAA